jgi:hypothetical protein
MELRVELYKGGHRDRLMKIFPHPTPALVSNRAGVVLAFINALQAVF